MRELTLYLDMLMCLLWIVTYTLVLIGTIKYRYPLIAPITQAIIAPFEFSVLIRFIIQGSLDFGYVSLAYIYWTIIEILIIGVIIKRGYIQRKLIIPYLLLICTMTGIMCYWVVIKNCMFFFSYFNTFIGELFWLHFILKTDYPMKPLALAAFVAKFVGDAISIPTYLGDGIWLISAICVLLPVLDFLFILIYFKRSKERKHLSNYK